MYKGTSVKIRCVFCCKNNHELRVCHLYNELERQLVAKYPETDITSIAQLCWNTLPMVCKFSRGWQFRRRHMNRENVVRRTIDIQRNTVLCMNNNNYTTTTEERTEAISTSKRKWIKRKKKWKRRLEEFLRVRPSWATGYSWSWRGFTEFPSCSAIMVRVTS